MGFGVEVGDWLEEDIVVPLLGLELYEPMLKTKIGPERTVK